MSAKLEPPYTKDQYESFNEYQLSGVFHPFTCPNRLHKKRESPLVADGDGLYCPNCGYEQKWAWKWMLDGEWKVLFEWQRNLFRTAQKK